MDLWQAEKIILPKIEPKYPIIFIVGAHRSGTTLLLQWLANTTEFSYPTNLLSRFYMAPILGAKIQLLLTDEKYNFRNELFEFRNFRIDYESKNGKTKGVLAPNEFWFFWRRFLPFKDIDYLPSVELKNKMDKETLMRELYGVANVFRKPFVLKAMIMNYNLDLLDLIFKKAIFIYIKRDPLSNILSALEARKRQYGNIETWYSFKIPEYDELKKLNPYEQVAGQIYYINKAVEIGLSRISKDKKIIVQYEEFCRKPEDTYNQLKEKLKYFNIHISSEYKGVEKFKVRKRNVINSAILKAYKKFYGE